MITNILAKCYDYVGSYSEAYKYYSLSNKIIENTFKKKFNKNAFNDRVSKRLSSIIDVETELFIGNEIYDNRSDPVFLIGFPRSGTTLLDTILRTHKSIEVIEEKLLVENLIIINNYINNNLKI